MHFSGATFAQLENLDKAFGAIEDFRVLFPMVDLHKREHIENLFFSEEMVDKIQEGLSKVL
jgi:hypothetical protein